MSPVEFSYLKTIFGKSGQAGSGFARLPLKCRELLSYLSVHFFMDKEEELQTDRIQPVFIPAGNTVLWEFQEELNQDSTEEYDMGTSINNSYRSYKKLSINRIKRNIFLSYYAGEIEIEDKEIMADRDDSYLLSHLLMTRMDLITESPGAWLYTDKIPIPEGKANFPIREEFPVQDKAMNKRMPCRLINLNRMNRWIYFLFHHHYDRISPPGHEYYYPLSRGPTRPDPGIRAGPL